ncbi:MAG: hypothetical protein H0X66_19400 [Verrucomicrobia bacterium]|nr:hypothetical protein [Verrucomicrobiota bacterium]
MAKLTPREKRTVRFAIIGISIYLVLFCGLRGWRYLESKRSAYQQLVQEAKTLQQEVQPYGDKVEVVKTLMEAFQMDPLKLSRASIVAEASSAIQKAAASGGMQFGPIRETSSRAASKELSSMQMEGSGPVAAIMGFLHTVTTLGYPLVVDAVQISGDPTKPGSIKVSLTIVILDFEQWKKQEVPNA